MNNQQLYLAWLRTAAPDVYTAALRKTFNRPRTLGGLGSDLLQSMTAPATFGSFGQDDSSDSSMDMVTITADSGSNVLPDLSLNPFPDVQALTPDQLTNISPIDVGPAPTALPDISNVSPPDGSDSWFTSLINNVGKVAATAITASNQTGLVKLNTQRASMGLPPVNASGQIVRTGSLAPSTNTIYRLESQIAGSAGSVMPFALLAGIGVLAFVLLKR